MRVVSIDPGPRESAWVILQDGIPVDHGEWKNELLVLALRRGASTSTFSDPRPDLLALEDFISYGKVLSAHSIDTCKAIGDFRTAWFGPHVEIPRPEIRKHLCFDASTKIKDKDVAAACQARFGGPVRAGRGKKCRRCKGKGWVGRDRPVCGDCGGLRWEIPPGPLKDFSGSHLYAALGVGLVAYDTRGER